MGDDFEAFLRLYWLDDYEVFLTPIPQLHLGQGCVSKLCQSLKAQVCHLSPPLQQQLAAHRGHGHSFWAGIYRSCLLFCCHYHIANSKWLWNVTPVFRGNFIYNMKSTCILPSTVRGGCLSGWNFPSWMHIWALLKGQWYNSERTVLGRLFDFEVRVTHMTNRHINTTCKMVPPEG